MAITLSTGEDDILTEEGTLHYSIFGTGPACIWLGGGPGIDPRYVEDLGGIDDTVTLVVLHPRGAGLSRFPLRVTGACRRMPATWRRCASTLAWSNHLSSDIRTAAGSPSATRWTTLLELAP